MKNLKFKIVILLAFILMGSVMIIQQRNIGRLKQELSNNKLEVASLHGQINQVTNDKHAYQLLYETQESEITDYRRQANEAKNELQQLKEQIYVSKVSEQNISRGEYQYKDLSQFEIMTVEEMNQWIANRAPEDSPFIGQGEAFLKASQLYNKDPKFIVALAATETSWGKSNIAVQKGNYFNIGAYNHAPYESAYVYNGSFEDKISQGLDDINKSYFENGYTTLYDIQHSAKYPYAQLDNGSANPQWISTITNIIYHGN